MNVLQSLIADRWVGSRAGASLASAIDGSAIHHAHADEIDFGEALSHARGTGVPALMAMDFQQRAARLKALAAYLNERKEALYAISRHTGATRSDSWVDIEGGTGTLYAYASMGGNELPSGQRRPRGSGGAARQEGPLRRQPHPGAARRRRGAHQRLQLPDLGPAREVRADLPRRHAVHRQAGDRDQLPDRGDGADDGRVGPAAAGQPAARDRLDRRPARPARQPGRRHLHRLGRHRAQAARQPQPAGEVDPVQRRGRFAQRRDPRPRRAARRRGVRPVRQGGGARDDGEGGAEVHRDPARDRAAPAPRRARREAARAAVARRLRRPGGRGREDGRARLAGAAAGRGRAGGDARSAATSSSTAPANRSRRSARARPTAPSSRRRCCSAATA